jgi:hypothetical protein
MRPAPAAVAALGPYERRSLREALAEHELV